MRSSARLTTPSFSLIRGGPLYRLQRRLGLIPARGLGVPRRAVALTLLAWAPMILLALLARRLFPGDVPEPLLVHFAVHARCLLAIPLLILAEAVAEQAVAQVVAQFAASGVVGERSLPAFADAVSAAARVRDSGLGLAALLAFVVVTGVTLLHSATMSDELSWALAPGGGLLAAGWWYVLVARPLFSLLVALWLWRLAVLWVLFRHVARIDLELVPTHPDAAGGLGFLGGVPMIFVPVILALSSVLAARLGHEVLHHGLRLHDSLWMLGVWAALVVVLFVSPLLVFAPDLTRLRARALREYGALVARHNRLVHRRWIRGERVADDALLSAPEIGPVADTLALYEAVEALRPVPFGTRNLVPLALAALVPMVPVVALEIPLRDILVKLAGVVL